MYYRCVCALVALFACIPAWAEEKAGLRIIFVDTEGGAATLIVTPAGESVLIDSGNPGRRDAERIARAAKEIAGLSAIDHHVITHWHLDHYGGVERLVQIMPIRHFYHRGIPDTLAEDAKNFPVLIKAFRGASMGKDTAMKPGDLLPLKAANGPKLEMRCLCANGETVPDARDAPRNPIAEEHKPAPEDKSDNARSVGFLLRFGDFKFLDLGDLTWNVEYKLVHPTDKIGPVDVYQVTHHGLEISNNPVLIKTVKPRVAVFNNGPRKGCHPQVTGTLRRLPEEPTIFQLHRNVAVGANENTRPELIANSDAECKAEPIVLTVAADGATYDVRVGAQGKPHAFKTRK